MIGILYLVLLGLIALEAPENLLDAFKRIGDSLTTSKTNVQTGIDNTFDAFRKTKLVEQPERAKPIYDKALKASELSNSLNAYVEQLKKTIIDESGGFDPATNDYKGRENVDVANHLMVDDEGKKEGKVLRDKINNTREQMMALLSDKERVGVNLALQATDPPHVAGFPQKTWEQANFGDGVPVGAAVTNLIKIQSDIKNSENEVVKKILGEVDQAVVNLDKFSAVAVAPTSYVLVGQPYTAEVFLTAYDSKSNPDITVGGSRLPTEEGKGKYVGSTSTEGLHTWTGSVTVKQNDGSPPKTYTTPPQTYMVARPSAVVSPDKMLVLYIGVPNPLSVSAPGVGKESINVSISSGSIKGSGGNYTAEVSTPGEATVTVLGKIGTGAGAKTMTLGATKFRVKRIPDPKAQFAGMSSGTTSVGNLRGQDALFAKLEGFEFDAHFTVKSFTLIVIKPRQDPIVVPGNGGELNSQMKATMNGITAGTTVVFRDIIAVGPDGKERPLDAMVLSAR